MITVGQAMENPELVIKHKDKFKNIKLFEEPWYVVFQKYPYLYREFPDKFNEMIGSDIACAVGYDPTMILDLKEYLHKMGIWDAMGRRDIDWVMDHRPEMSLCMKYREYPDKVEAAYYITFPHELNNLNNEEKREMGKKVIEFLKEEKA
jgi:hypothetical protein